MEIMISINPPYAEMIMDGYKSCEFRKVILKSIIGTSLTEPTIAYIYETKNKGGRGAIIGEVDILGSYALGYSKDITTTDKLEELRLSFLKMMYSKWYAFFKELNIKDEWFNREKFTDYLHNIGFINKDGNIDCNYAIILDKPRRYDRVKPLSDFLSVKGEILSRPPQNMFYVNKKIKEAKES